MTGEPKMLIPQLEVFISVGNTKHNFEMYRKSRTLEVPQL